MSWSTNTWESDDGFKDTGELFETGNLSMNAEDTFRPRYENNFLLEMDETSMLRLSGQFEKNLFFDEKEGSSLFPEKTGIQLDFDCTQQQGASNFGQFRQPDIHVEQPAKPPTTIPSFARRASTSHAQSHIPNAKPNQAFGQSPTSYQPTSPFPVSQLSIQPNNDPYLASHSPRGSYQVKFSPNSNSPRSNSLYSMYSPSTNTTNALNNINTISLNHNASNVVTTPYTPMFNLTDSVGMNVEPNPSNGHFPSTPNNFNTSMASNTQSNQRQQLTESCGMNVEVKNDFHNEPLPNLTTPLDIIQAVKKTNEFSQLKIQNAFSQQRICLMNLPQELNNSTIAPNLQTIREELRIQQTSLLNVYKALILDPFPLHQTYYLLRDIEVQLKQVELLLQEWQNVHLGSLVTKAQCLAVLMISIQPFPLVIQKGNHLNPEVLQVKLLTASGLEMQLLSTINCSLINEKGPINENVGIPCLSHGSQSLDLNTRTAKFPLKFNYGTKKSVSTVKFNVNIQVNYPHLKNDNSTNSYLIESNYSEPFIVITNETQWEDAHLVLLKQDIFAENMFVSWSYFCNTLQRHFLSATKQSPLEPDRCLGLSDFNYFHTKFFSLQDMITPKQFDAFWLWYSKVLKVLRYSRPVFTMWSLRLICGFLTKYQIEKSLENHENGTFIIRFSESFPGQFAVGYVGAGGQPKHYLIEPKDLQEKKNLADFICECVQFSNVLLFGGDFKFQASKVVPKSEVYFQYTTPNLSPPANSKEGYDPLENPWHITSSTQKKAKFSNKRVSDTFL